MKSHVSMEQHRCVVCGMNYDTGAVLLHKHLKPDLERYTLTGGGLCPEHRKLYEEGYVALVEIDLTLSTKDGMYRTGNVAHVRRSAAEKIFNVPIAERAPLAYAEVGVLEKLAAMVED